MIFQPTHTHSYSLRLGQCRHANYPKCTSLRCGKKLESPEKTHGDIDGTGRMCRLYRDSGSGLELAFFPQQYYTN